MVDAKLSINGEPVVNRLLRVSIQQEMGRHTYFDIAIGLPAKSENTLDPASLVRAWLGQAFSLEFNVEGAPTARYLGVLTRFVFTNDHVLLSGCDLSQRMDQAVRSRGFAETTNIEIVRELAAAHKGLVKVQVPVSKHQKRFMAQVRETDFEFLLRLAAEEGWLVYDTGTNLAVEVAVQSQPLTLKEQDLPGGIGQVSLAPVHLGVSAHGEGRSPGQPYTADLEHIHYPASDQMHDLALEIGWNAFGGQTGFLYDEEVDSTLALKQKLETKARQVAAETVCFETTTDRIEVRLASMIRFQDHPVPHSLLLVIRTSTQYTDEGDYYTAFTAVPAPCFSGVGIPRPVPSETVATAVVTENIDPEKNGRVKVCFPWSREAPVWARVAALGAGASHGSGWAPAPGDEVVVGFANANPNRPIVLGSLYNDEARPQYRTEEGRSENLLARTSAGHEIRITEAGGEDELCVLMADGRNEWRMRLGKTPEIRIKTEGECHIKGKNLFFEAEDTLSLKGRSIAIKASEQVTAHGQGLRFEADQNLDMKASVLKQKAGQQACIEGARIQIKGDGDVTVEGAVIKLN